MAAKEVSGITEKINKHVEDVPEKNQITPLLKHRKVQRERRYPVKGWCMRWIVVPG